jgi:hypothetical protein
MDQSSGLPSNKQQQRQPRQLMDDFLIHNAVVNSLDSHRSEQNLRELLRVRRVLLESHGAVEDACGCDDHGHVVGCEGFLSADRSFTWARVGFWRRTHLSMVLQESME